MEKDNVDWLKEFDERLVNRFSAGLEIKYKFGILNKVKFRIGRSCFSGKKRLECVTNWDRYFVVVEGAGHDLRENICRNMEGIVVAFQEEERRQERINERVEELDL